MYWINGAIKENLIQDQQGKCNQSEKYPDHKSGNEVWTQKLLFFLSFLFQDRTIAENFCPQTPDGMDISESFLSHRLKITSSDLKDSSSCTEKELSVSEMVIIGFIWYKTWLNTYDNFAWNR